MGFDHVGLHHQPDLPPIVQEIPCRGAEADRTGSPVGLRSEITPTPCPDGCWSLPSRDAGGAPNVRDDKAVLLSLRHDPGPRDRGLSVSKGRAKSPTARQTQFKFSDPVPRPVKACVKILFESRQPDRPTSATTHIVSAGAGRCAIYPPLLNGQCVSPANTGWDWLEFRPANAALRNGLSSAAPVIALKKFPLPVTL